MKQDLDEPIISYDEYRKHIEKLAYAKQKFLAIVKERKDLHRTYRTAFQKYRELQDKEIQLREELVQLIPSKI